jgi:hypothetical protein
MYIMQLFKNALFKWGRTNSIITYLIIDFTVAPSMQIWLFLWGMPNVSVFSVLSPY